MLCLERDGVVNGEIMQSTDEYPPPRRDRLSIGLSATQFDWPAAGTAPCGWLENETRWMWWT